ncbi:protein Jumonji isoform X1 [Nasonia vitripennis]|uniref:Protein Jumonji n=1 Tax=Nasonia vitripennis TaxID=7425 RepID=A0A7M7QR16_NASVI|nr:protein Jumonji isoform X1 [Nasonia vitripennis]XP_031789603.1 protein Jumonji isoform X1 [Nasonia vitripennis]XP_031789604.1 protein Jumonji isoform X1 [Nasonia vitripennis]XP_031789605.1 protein Jumonji isoform X1 [Nasonia vitripennis]
MVLSRNDKRKRKEGDLVDLMDPIAEPPKSRTKIHAQRKFAQGVATPVFSPASTPIKEKEKTKPTVFRELITHKRPNTEDFLTFLCFRGTSILPPSLNFFSATSKKDKLQDGTKTPGSLFSKTNGTCGKPPTLSKAENNTVKAQTATASSQKASAAAKDKTIGKQKATAPAAKPAKLKSTSTAIQALKKKYQEQRLAKQRLGKFKPSCMKTRSGATTTAVTKVPAKKNVSKEENRRHGLRSTGLPESEKKSLPLRKPPTLLAKKKIKDVEAKKPTQVAKKLLEKSKKIEARRVTRSRPAASEPSPPPARRPTRKTKEAAAVYMEILGRKLVSPELENEDNLSLDSFPELPNARKIAQTENEIKAKVKSQKAAEGGKSAAKDKEKKPASNPKPAKKKVIKPPVHVKNKRLVKVQKYCELNSEDEAESVTSKESAESIKPRAAMTRRSAPAATSAKDKKTENRSLRSSRSLAPRKSSPKASEVQQTGSNDTVKSSKAAELQNPTKAGKESAKDPAKEATPKDKMTTAGKRKRETNDKEIASKQKSETAKNKSKAVAAEPESEEESLGTLLNKMKKKKENEKEKEESNHDQPAKKAAADPKPAKTMSAIKSTMVETLKSQAEAESTAKISDDEESFRGFTKKAVSKVLNTCQTHVLANSVLEEMDSKINSLLKFAETNDKLNSTVPPGVKVDTKSGVSSFSCVKYLTEQMTSTGANASVKQDPDFGDLKPTTKHSKISTPTTASLNIIDMPKNLSSRKERVNMSTEQIEKWLNESSLAKEESKVEMESVSNFKYESLTLEKPKTHPEIPMTPTHGHLSISPKIQHLVRPVNVTLSKLSDRLKKASSAIGPTKMPTVFLTSPIKLPQASKAKTSESPVQTVSKEKKNPPSTPPSRKMSKDSSFGEDAADSDAVSKSDANSVGDSSEKKSLNSPEKKVFFHQRKPFLPKVKERKKEPSSTSAFSPENESSVYAFESEAEAPVSTPFRRKAKDAARKDSVGAVEKDKSTNEKSSSSSEAKGKSGEETKTVTEPLNSPEEARKDEEKSPPLLERTTPKNFELPKNFADLTNIQVLPLDKLTTSWSNVNCSASIAVQVNLDEQKQQQQQQQQQQVQQNQQQSTTAEGNNDQSNAAQKSTEISTQTDTNTDNDDDDSGQLFYIPLQAVTRNASAQGGQQLIQGVAVKLGTEGPTGPNQRVLLKAKLVTKPPISIARCPPIGTVQPTARAPQNASVDQADLPSTSTVDIDGGFKFPIPSSKSTKTISSTEIHKSPSPEKIMKSPISNVRERKMSSEGPKARKSGVKAKPLQIHSPVNKTDFPKGSEDARLVEAPTFRPSEKDFQDPLEYIDKIRPIAEKFGICKVVPPSNFKPECKVSDDMRFTAYNHYVHRMLNRWGPNVKEMMAIKKYLATQSITLTQPPWIGGMEVDLPHLYQTVQNLGGLKEVIEKKKWQKVADGMKIPRSAQDRVTKLDDIYCKYLLPYDTLSQDERDKLFKDVEADWAKREKRERQETQSNDTEDEDDEDSSEEIEECIVKGRNMPLNAFYRIARNTQRMWFGEPQRSTNETDGASVDEVETAFWRHVVEKKRHVCVHAASIDSGGRGFGFSVAKNSPFARHPWNLKILTNNVGSVLRALGPQMGVTVPTLHVGMLFSACCWYRDPHGLPWVEYLHTGAKKIWYGIPDEQNATFRRALSSMFPRHCKNKRIWLPSDTAMVPPDMLVENGVPLCQTVQEPGQFIVVFPKAFTSSICTGYVVSESVYFAQASWLETAEQVFQDIHDSCEPSIFSFERLLFSIINDTRSHIDVLKQILPTVIKVCDKEIENRKKLKELGLTNTEKLPLPENDKKGKAKKVKEEEGDYECDTCRANLFVSLVSNPTDESIFCLTHAIQYIQKKKQVCENCTLMYTYSESELNDLIHKLKDRIEAKSKKTNQTKQAK